MNDEQYTPALGTWLKDTDVAPPDPQASALQIMTGLPAREKRRSWWPFHRQTAPTAPPTTDETIDYQPTPIPATNGHTPTVTGRTQSMFSPAKAITAGALVFAIGGALLIAQPFDQQRGSVPGAATDAEGMDPAKFTADATLVNGSYVEVGCESSDGVEHCRDELQMAVDASDSRASGTLTYGLNRDRHSTVNVQAGTVTVENDDGIWAGTFTGYWDQQNARIFHAQLVGQDGYEGWTMLLDDVCACTTPTSVMQGVIIPGDLPPAE